MSASHVEHTHTRTEPTAPRRARAIVALTGAISAALGVILWLHLGVAVGAPHMALGAAFVVATWTVAAMAARAGARARVVAPAVAWGVALAALGVAQKGLLPGPWHWIVQVAHAATGVFAMLSARRALGFLADVDRAPCATPIAAIDRAAAHFLSRRRVAVTGVSRSPRDHGGNVVFRRLRERGYDVFAVNPSATEVEGARCYPDLASIPGGVDAVVIATHPRHAMATVRECVARGIGLVWMHRALGPGSVSEEAVAWARAHGVRVIDGGCPLMFAPVADVGHRVMRPLVTLAGKAPSRVPWEDR